MNFADQFAKIMAEAFLKTMTTAGVLSPLESGLFALMTSLYTIIYLRLLIN